MAYQERHKSMYQRRLAVREETVRRIELEQGPDSEDYKRALVELERYKWEHRDEDQY